MPPILLHYLMKPLLIHLLQRSADVINRKKMSAVWFPYTAIERLWCQLEELRRSSTMVDQSEKLQKLLHGALLNHLKQVGFIVFFYRFLDYLIFCFAPGINLCFSP